MTTATPTFRSPRRRLFSSRTSCRSVLERMMCLVVNNLSPSLVNSSLNRLFYISLEKNKQPLLHKIKININNEPFNYRIRLTCDSPYLVIPLLRRVLGNALWRRRILNGLHAAGYTSAESKPIWTKFGKLSAKCWLLAMADFGRDPRCSHSLRGSRNNVFLVR